MKNLVNERDIEIEKKKKEHEELQRELDKKDKEIKEKDIIIKNLKDKEDSFSSDSDENDENYLNESDNNGMLIGSGHFGKFFEVREGIEKEAIALRKEWRQKQ